MKYSKKFLLSGFVEKVIKDKLQEGLIRTAPIEDTLHILNNHSEWIVQEPRLHTTRYGIEIFNSFKVIIEKSNFNKIDKLLQLTNNLGWFPSMVGGFDRSKIERKEVFSGKYTKASLERCKKISDLILLIFEAKFDAPVDTGNLDYLYHATPFPIWEKKISKIGLSPKTKSKASNHPDRIYFTANVSESEMIASQLDDYSGYSEYAILKIDFRPYKKKVPVYSDVNAYGWGVYITKNINPKHISLVKRISV